jgi:serine/threonine protein kinase
MNSDRWNKLRRLHSAALDLPPSGWAAYLRGQCGDDHGLYNEVLGLLHEQAEGDFLSTPPPTEGVSLGDFELREEMGSGGTGIVYRAWQHSLSREVALKLLPRHFALNQERVARFQREARAAAKLTHPGIAPIYEVGHEGDSHFFTMELIEGRDLAGEIVALRERAPSPLPKVNTPEYFRAVASLVERSANALGYAHEKGVVHRDVKPHNILLDPSGQPRLVDFGLAKDEALGSITITDRVEGTPYYMSPEQAQALKGKVDARTDVYSLGAVLYELLTLARPYEGGTSKEIIDKILIRDPKPVRSVNSAVPTDLAVICAKAMEREVKFRYASASALEEDLRRFQSGEPILARPMSAPRKLKRAVRANRLAVGMVGGVLLVVFASRVTYAWAIERSWAKIEITTQQDSALDSSGVEVWAQALGPAGNPLEVAPVALGGLPVREKLGAGVWRIRAMRDADLAAEFTLTLAWNQEAFERSIYLVEPTESNDGMVLVDPPNWKSSVVCNMLPEETDIEPFWVDKTQVTIAEYRHFCEQTGHSEPTFWSEFADGEQPGDFPVTGILGQDARDYANWAGKRLLTHLELEYLIRGAEGRAYPWGESEPTEALCAPLVAPLGPYPSRRARFDHFRSSVFSVGSFPAGATPDGVLDLFGAPSEHLATPATTSSEGGVVGLPEWAMTIGNYYLDVPEDWDMSQYVHQRRPASGKWLPFYVGFRCAKSAER